MEPPPRSSSPAAQAEETALAVLVACHHRGPLTRAELALLLPDSATADAALDSLLQRGLLRHHGERHAITHQGREHLDGVLEAIESQIAPDDPAYVRRYRRESASLPFAANTIWAEALCINIRVDPAALRPLVPAAFDLDLYDGWAFVSLTASRLKDFGVGRVPRALRMNFYQATYRAHATFTDFRGRTIKGCYFVRSETNSGLMSMAANMLPEFKAHHCSTYPILMLRQHGQLILSVDSGPDPAGKVVLVLDTAHPLPTMPPGSVFPTIQAARTHLVDFHDAFSQDPDTGEIYILQIDRGDWDIRIVQPIDHYLGYISDGPFPPAAAHLDSVFYFTDVPYRWLPLLKERIRQPQRP